MRILDSFKFLDKATAPKTSNTLVNANNGSTLVLQVSGTSSSFSLTVEGKIDIENGDFEPIGIINNKDFATSSVITSKGTYSIGVGGYSQIVVKLNSIGGGNINTFGKLGD